MNFNEYLFRAINGMAHKNVILDNIMIVFSKYVPDVFMLLLAVLFFLGVFKKSNKIRGIAIDTFVITVINLVLSYLIGMIWYIPRPFVNSNVNLLFSHVADASFPSDHAIGTMSIALGINRYNKAYGAASILMSILVGISRVYVGHHFPSDVIGGYAVVLLINIIYMYALKNKVQNLYLRCEKLLVKYVPVLEKYI